MKDARRRPRVRLQVGSTSFVIPEQNDTLDEEANPINVVQQSVMIVNGFRDNQPAGRQDSTAEWC